MALLDSAAAPLEEYIKYVLFESLDKARDKWNRELFLCVQTRKSYKYTIERGFS